MKQLEIVNFFEAAQMALQAGEKLARQKNIRVYAVAGKIIESQTNEVVSYGRWLNLAAPTPNWMKEYDIEAFAHSKMATALHHRSDTPPDIMLKGDAEFQGGVELSSFCIGVSGGEEAEDVEIAGAILQVLLDYYPPAVQAHHIGVRFASEAEYRYASALIQRAGFKAIDSPAPDHQRVYFNLGGIYFECQYFPGVTSSGTHIDVVHDNPIMLLSILDKKPEIWGENEEPCGQVRLGSGLTLMVRSTDWDPAAS